MGDIAGADQGERDLERAIQVDDEREGDLGKQLTFAQHVVHLHVRIEPVRRIVL